MFNKIIKVEKKRVYGNELVYVKSEHEPALTVLTGKLTIDQADRNALTDLGFEFEVIVPEL
jgi:hypothetical protein